MVSLKEMVVDFVSSVLSRPPTGTEFRRPPASLPAASSGLVRSHNPASLDALVGEGRQHHTQYRLQAAWRLKGVAEGGSAEETDIRLPPLNPGERFADRYQVAPSPVLPLWQRVLPRVGMRASLRLWPRARVVTPGKWIATWSA